MRLDTQSVLAMTAVVVYVAGVLFLLEMMMRRQERVGRVWGLSFLAGMLASASYNVWALGDDSMLSAATGNGAIVASAGFMWVGCRAFNVAKQLPSAVIVTIASVGVYITTIATADQGDWAGAVPMFLLIALFTALAAFEAARGDMRRQRTAGGFALVLGLVSAYHLARTAVFIGAGPESDLFERWFSTASTSVVIVVLTIVALVSTSVLRAERARVRGVTSITALQRGEDGVLTADSFALTAAELRERAAAKGELVAVVSVQMRELDEIATAFGGDEGHRAEERIRAVTRAAAPSQALVGNAGAAELAVAFVPASVEEADAVARSLAETLEESLREAALTVVPTVAVGVAVAPASEGADLLNVARGAAAPADGGQASGVSAGI